jgi:hypothetical protein
MGSLKVISMIDESEASLPAGVADTIPRVPCWRELAFRARGESALAGLGFTPTIEVRMIRMKKVCQILARWIRRAVLFHFVLADSFVFMLPSRGMEIG